MRISFELQPTVERKFICLPIHYNHTVQGFIYAVFDKLLASALHDRGYIVGQRRFRMFVFSRLQGRFRIDKEKHAITYPEGCELVISSPMFNILQSLLNGLMLNEDFRLGHNQVRITKTEVYEEKVVQTPIKVQTLSPIVLYSTLLRADGRKYTCYFQPKDPDFNRLAIRNLQKKYQVCYNRELTDGNISVKPLNMVRQHVVQFKGTIIKGYSGKFELTGSQDLLQMALDAGLGSKNSQGFGCLKLLK